MTKTITDCALPTGFNMTKSVSKLSQVYAPTTYTVPTPVGETGAVIHRWRKFYKIHALLKPESKKALKFLNYIPHGRPLLLGQREGPMTSTSVRQPRRGKLLKMSHGHSMVWPDSDSAGEEEKTCVVRPDDRLHSQFGIFAMYRSRRSHHAVIKNNKTIMVVQCWHGFIDDDGVPRPRHDCNVTTTTTVFGLVSLGHEMIIFDRLKLRDPLPDCAIIVLFSWNFNWSESRMWWELSPPWSCCFVSSH